MPGRWFNTNSNTCMSSNTGASDNNNNAYKHTERKPEFKQSNNTIVKLVSLICILFVTAVELPPIDKSQNATISSSILPN